MLDSLLPSSHYRYSRWDGTQHISPFDAEELMENLADDLLADGDVRSALQRLLQRGFQRNAGGQTMGLQQLLERLRSRRQEQLDRYDLGGMLDQIKEKLEDVIKTERGGINRRLDEARGQPAVDGEQESGQAGEEAGEGSPEGSEAEGQQLGQRSPAGSQASRSQQSGRGQNAGQPPSPEMLKMLEDIAGKKQRFLDELPEDPGGAIKQLNDYDFMDPEAREKFQELLAMLQQQMMQSYFQGMQQGMQSMTPQDMAAMRQMLQDLNQMLRDRAEGREPDFEQFMQRWGQNFPEGIESLDDLMEHLQNRMNQMQSLLQSMTPEQRREL